MSVIDPTARLRLGASDIHSNRTAGRTRRSLGLEEGVGTTARLRIAPVQDEVSGTVAIPASVANLQRGLIMGWLARGETMIRGKSAARRVQDTVQVVRSLGARVVQKPAEYLVQGGTFHAHSLRTSVGRSADSLQFLLGLASQVDNGPVVFRSQTGMLGHAVPRVAEVLAHLAVRVAPTDPAGGLVVCPGQPRAGPITLGGDWGPAVSGLLMLAPFASGPVSVHLTPRIRDRTDIDRTVRLLRRFGIEVADDPEANRWTVPGGQYYRPSVVERRPDWSLAAFLLALAAMNPSRLTLVGVREPGIEHPEGEGEGEARILQILRAMGLKWTWDPTTESLWVVHGDERLEGADIDLADTPDLLPILCVIASRARGRTVLRHVGRGRHKESDRVQGMLQLRRMGAVIEVRGDDLVIDGQSVLHGATINTYNDHRLLMAYAIAGTAATGPTWLNYPWAYRVSYPEFLDQLTALHVSAAIISDEAPGNGGAAPTPAR